MTPTPSTENTFGQDSGAYAVARPRYPTALYDWILERCRARDAAWDCATGNGQAAIELCRRFRIVYASDISHEQVTHGLKAPNIVYSVQRAEATQYPDKSFDLITVAQALHWFDYREFWNEVRRVAKVGSFFCAWGYAWFACDQDVEHRLVLPFRRIIEPYWAANNRILWDGYRDSDISFPFERIGAPAMSIDVAWTVPQLISYMETWSAYKRARQNHAAARELDALVCQALDSFSNAPPIEIRMPLAIAAGHV